MYKYAAHIYIFLSDKKTSVIFNLLLNCTPHLARLSCLRVLYWYTLYSVLLCITLLRFASNSCLILSTAIRDLVVCFFFFVSITASSSSYFFYFGDAMISFTATRFLYLRRSISYQIIFHGAYSPP